MKAILFFSVILILFLSCSSDEVTSTNEVGMSEMEKNENGEVKPLTGDFVEDTHPTMGKAQINIERTVLTLTNFKSDDGPVLELYLANDLKASKYITLGELKGLDGNYTYDLPKNINLETYKYLMVWCVDFSVSFGHAVLK